MTQLEFVSQIIDANAEETKALAREVWGYAELAYEETKSAAALAAALEAHGFTVEMGIAGMPTAFTATFKSGSGKPVAAILGEYDALDALSQAAAKPEKDPRDIANALKANDTKLVYRTELDSDEDRIIECVIQSTAPNEKIDYIIIPNAFDGNVNTVIYRTLSDIVSDKDSSVKRRFSEKNGSEETEFAKAKPIGENQLENGCFFVINGKSFILLPKAKASAIDRMLKEAIPFINAENKKRAKAAEKKKSVKNETSADEVQLKTYNRATISNGGKGNNRIDAQKITVIDNTSDDGVILSGTREPREKVGFFKERFPPFSL